MPNKEERYFYGRIVFEAMHPHTDFTPQTEEVKQLYTKVANAVLAAYNGQEPTRLPPKFE